MKVSAQDLTNYRRKTSVHPWHIPYSPQCIIPSCGNKTYHDGKTHYSLCLGCLKENSFGPFRKTVIKEDYSSVFWLSDFERNNSRKETLQ